MREKNITRTISMTLIEVSLYNKDTKEIEVRSIVAPEITDVDKFLTKKFADTAYVVLEYKCSASEHKYSMSLEDFIKYGEEV